MAGTREKLDQLRETLAIAEEPAGASGIAGRRQLEQVPEEQRAAVREFMIDQYNTTVATPWIAAERGYIDAVIEPSRTRLEIRHALRLLRDKEAAAEPNPRKHSLYPM